MTNFLDSAVTLCESMAVAHGLSATAASEIQYPAVVCDLEAVDLAEQIADDLTGPDTFRCLPNPGTDSEDFSWVLAAVPGAMLAVGARPADAGSDAPFNHSPKAVFDDGAPPIGAALLAELADRRLRQG